MEFGGPPADQRAAGCRELARTHVKIALSAADPAQRALHLEQASLWTRLAEAAQRQTVNASRNRSTIVSDTDAPTQG